MSATHNVDRVKPRQSKELKLTDKLIILKILSDEGIKIDFSGGDPLFYEDDFNIVKTATVIMPKKDIDVSMTGCDFTDKKLQLLKKVGKVEMSVDNIPGEYNPYRPNGFNSSALDALEILIKEKIFCSAVTTLYSATATKDKLLGLYELLCAKGIPKWNILRFYPVGRGVKFKDIALSVLELLAIMDFLDSLNGSIEIVFQHSLRLLRGEYQCHAAIKSVGILPDGTVTACGWALDKDSLPLNGFRLGRLPKDSFNSILKNAQDNMGYCKRQNFCRIMNYLGQR